MAGKSNASKTSGKAAAPRPRQSTTTPETRRPGRPPAGNSRDLGKVKPLISRENIMDRAAQLAMTEPLNDLSIVGLAREFGVTTALIHYYAGSRDDLISGVINRYFKARVERFEPLTKDWRNNIEAHSRAIFDLTREYGGVLQYLMSHNRFRLFQQVSSGETDYGLVYLNRLGEIFQAGGFTPEQSAMGYHLLAQYLMTAAYADVNRQLPVEHGDYILGRIQSTSKEQFPGAHFIAEPFSRLDSESAFTAGLKILLDGISSWRPAKRHSK